MALRMGEWIRRVLREFQQPCVVLPRHFLWIWRRRRQNRTASRLRPTLTVEKIGCCFLLILLIYDMCYSLSPSIPFTFLYCSVYAKWPCLFTFPPLLWYGKWFPFLTRSLSVAVDGLRTELESKSLLIRWQSCKWKHWLGLIVLHPCFSTVVGDWLLLHSSLSPLTLELTVSCYDRLEWLVSRKLCSVEKGSTISHLVICIILFLHSVSHWALDWS